MDDPDSLAALFVASFNRDLAALGSLARVGRPSADNHREVLELQDAQGNFLCFVPECASAEMVDIAYRLYAEGLKRGILGGEQAAWARLRHLIGAAADHGD